MYCKYYAIRTKKGVKYGYCRLLNTEVQSCYGCDHKEYKTYKPLGTKKKAHIKAKKHRMTKYTDIPQKIKKEVWERDNHCCIFCGKPVPMSCANSHYVKRSQKGLGIPKNLMTNCFLCHKECEETSSREKMLLKAKKYLKSIYPDWDEKDLVYHKYYV